MESGVNLETSIPPGKGNYLTITVEYMSKIRQIDNMREFQKSPCQKPSQNIRIEPSVPTALGGRMEIIYK